MVLLIVFVLVFVVLLVWLRTFKNKVQQERLRKLSNLSTIDPYQFQFLTARLMRAKGWKNARVNQKLSADGGWDVTGKKDGEKWLGQCKRYAFKSSISVDEIRKLHGVCNSVEHGPALGIFIATCKFSEPAKVFAKNNNILLWDLKTLIDFLQ